MVASRVPDQGDLKTSTRWYWEAGHFKQALGDVMLRRMFAAPEDSEPEFGTQLTLDNLEQTIERLRQERAWYEQVHTHEATAIRDLVRRW